MGIRETVSKVKDVYGVASDKAKRSEVLSLRKEKRYDEIYDKYGQTVYRLATPEKHRKAEMKKLMEEGRYEDIFRKHGESEYNKRIPQMMQKEVEMETGKKAKGLFARVKEVIAHKVAPIFLATTLALPGAAVAGVELGNKMSRDENAVKYEEQIQEYDRRIGEYASEIRMMNLSTTEICMKLMDDMWESIDGYGNGTIDRTGYLRLSLQEEGQGVCRHFADDMAAKLNAINPKYNARTATVYMSEADYTLADIDRTVLQSNNTVAGSEQTEEEKSDDFAEVITDIVGNHAVTLFDANGATLVLDPTNPGIGVVKDGQIHMFSTPDGKGLEFKHIGQFFMNSLGSSFELGATQIASFAISDADLQALEEVFGIAAQSEALNHVRELNDSRAVEALISGSSFDDRIKVNDREILHKIQEESEKASQERDAGVQIEETQEITTEDLEK